MSDEYDVEYRESSVEERRDSKIVRVNTPEQARERIRTAANRWRQNYNRKDWWDRELLGGLTAKEIHARLAKLDGETASAADVAAVIGNQSWTEDVECSICGDASAVLRIGDEPDYEARYVNICPDCLMVAVSRLPPREPEP